jgi:hypothetical protein
MRGQRSRNGECEKEIGMLGIKPLINGKDATGHGGLIITEAAKDGDSEMVTLSG